MSRKPVKVLIALSSVFFFHSASAQNIDRPFDNNPYSRYGLGEEMNSINPAIRAMGSTSTVFSDAYIINTDNPATYAGLKNFTYEGGLEGRRNTIVSPGGNYSTGTAGVSFLSIGIPMGKYAGGFIGFRPETKVGYFLTDSLTVSGVPSTMRYNGNGGLNNFFVGAAGTWKGLSLGVNFGYLFGTIREESWLQSASTLYSVSNSEFSRANAIGGFNFKLGGLYETQVGKNLTLRVGGTAFLSQNINAERTEYWISHPWYASDTTGADTALAIKGARTKIALPARYSGGISLSSSDKWAVNLTYNFSDWSKFDKSGNADSVGKSDYRVGVGAEYTPNSLSLYKYWQRVTYRIGGFSGQDFVRINNKQANYYALTFGLSLPFRRSTDRIQTGFEIGRYNNLGGADIQKNFVRISLGVSFHDKSFFVKRKEN